jgi:hypothetical protein
MAYPKIQVIESNFILISSAASQSLSQMMEKETVTKAVQLGLPIQIVDSPVFHSHFFKVPPFRFDIHQTMSN